MPVIESYYFIPRDSMLDRFETLLGGRKSPIRVVEYSSNAGGVGWQRWPSIPLLFWTLLGGFMAVGGSGVSNQHIDCYVGEKKRRTQKRPIPSERLALAKGLAFGYLVIVC